MRRTLMTGLWFGVLALSAIARAQNAAEEQKVTPSAVDGQKEPQRPGLVERTVTSFWTDDEPGAGRGIHLGPFFPRVEVVSSGGGLAPMLHFWAPDIGGTPLDIHASASYSIYTYQYYDLQVGLVPHNGEHLPRMERGTGPLFPLSDLEKTAGMPGFNIYASARYRDYPREDFYGLGATSLLSARTDYRLKDGLYEGVVRFGVPHFSLMARAGLFHSSISPGTDSAFPSTELSNSAATAPGLFVSTDFVHLSAGAWLELRDEPGNPHQGASLGVAYSRFDDRHGNAFQFNRAIVDAREYIPLGSKRHVIALRQATSLDTPDAGSSVPFYMQSSLGSNTFLGGYRSFRFRDDKLLALEAEYRFEMIPKLELALIYQTGKVFPTMSEFGLRNLRNSWGAGLRLKSPKKVHARVDVLHSPEGTRVHLDLGPSF